MKELTNKKNLLLDLDGTVYQDLESVFGQVSKLMTKYISEKLNLDSESEEQFSSIYFETQEKIFDKMVSYRKIKRDLYKNDSADSDECNSLIKKMYDIKRDELDIRESLMQELSKIISVNKVLRLPRIEEDFRITMINKIRGNNN